MPSKAKAAANLDWKSIDPSFKPHGATPQPPDVLQPIREEPQVASRNPVLVVGGILAVCAVAVTAIGLLITRNGDEPSASDANENRANSTSAIAQRPIFWGNTNRIVATTPGPGCQTSNIWTMTITDGARFAGKPAVIVRYGPDFPKNPTETFKVGPDGSFEVPYEGTACGAGLRGVALVSVDGNTNVLPPPPTQASATGGGARDETAAPAGPFNLYLQTASERSRGKDCRYKLGFSLQWPQSPPYKDVKGQAVTIALTGPGAPPSIEVQLVSQGTENIENVVYLTNSNLGTFTATIQSVGGKPIDSVAGAGSRLTSSVDNPCA